MFVVRGRQGEAGEWAERLSSSLRQCGLSSPAPHHRKEVTASGSDMGCLFFFFFPSFSFFPVSFCHIVVGKYCRESKLLSIGKQGVLRMG